eukprot:Nitzschia sp. Nitz4//scaffold76_size158648//141429//149315//NITZ4_002570-RA/size158648-processed-gene-0.274-mRNA-1//-1//CDS//3329557917//9282//frame0
MFTQKWAFGLFLLSTIVRGEDGTDRDDTSSFDNRQVLLSLYQATGGLDWTDSTDWFQQRVDICDWYGIQCYTESTGDSRRVGEIRSISLEDNHLVGTVPPEVFQIPYLESFNIADNADVYVDFSDLSQAQFLTFMDLSRTHVDSLSDIGGATNLETLHVTGLDLSGPLPSSLFELSNLESFFANDNSFTGTLPTRIAELTSLRELYLYGNDLTGQIPDEIGELRMLEVLTLAYNSFGGTLPETALNALTNLKILAIQRDEDATGDGISGSVPALSRHHSLTVVSLEHQNLSGSLDSDFLASCPTGEVVEVDLTSNQITGTVPSSLYDMTYLVLYLADNLITSVPTALYDQSGNSCPEMSHWMGGEVSQLGCNAFLCPPGTWAPEGRKTSDDSCTSCTDDSTRWGRVSCASSTSASSSQRQILVAMYNALGGPYWKEDDDWLDLDVSECDWYGITCNSNSLITSIVLRSNGLVGTLPTDVFSLPQLQTLNLASSDITFDFSGIGSASNLRSLNLDSIELSTSGIQELSSLNSLQSLSLAGNNLGGTIPSVLFSLTSLEELDIGHNDFTGTLDTRIGLFVDLETLSLDGNLLTGQLPTQLGNLVNLQVFSAGETRFGGSLPTQLNLMTSLQSLSLQQVVATGGIGGPLLALSDLERLTSLQLGSNQLTGSLPSAFLSNNHNLDSTITVGLSDNLFSGSMPSQWTRFDALDVDLAGNHISSIPQALCDIDNWVGGNAGEYDCDGILCSIGTANDLGRRTSGSECTKCSNGGTGYMGARSCDEQSGSFGDDDSSELSILSDFYGATLGTSWAQTTGWTDSSDPCDFYGVTCNTAGEVIAIDLTSNGLRGTVPSSLFKLPSLTELVLSHNTLSVDFDGISEAENLAVLSLDGVGLDSVSGIENAPNSLVSISLADNALTGDIFRELYSFSNLRDLDLSYNQYSGTLPNSVGDFSSLETLRLHHNQFEGRLPASIADLTNLQVLNLAENNFDGTIPIEFDQMTNIRFLSLQREGGILGTDDIGVDQSGSSALGAGLTGTLPAFDELPYLTELYLGVNSLSGSVPYNFLDGVTSVSSEIRVDLTSNRLTGTIPGSLTQFSSMSIYLAGNRISDIADGLCDIEDWMGNDVGQFECDGILCPSGTYNSIGRRSSSDSTCQPCPSGTNTSGFMGSFECLSASDHLESSERAILESFYNGMDGDSWLENTNWLDAEVSICDWYGIECLSDDNPSVASIDLEGNRLVNGLVTEIFSLPNLKSLNLQNNDIAVDLSGLNKATNLEYLDVAEIGLTTLSGVSGASGLKLLRAHGNSLTSFPTEVFSLQSLETLSLSDNDFPSQQVPTELQNLNSLAFFECGACGFTGSIPSWLGSMTTLEHIQWSQNALTGSLPSQLLQLENLVHLDLSDQQSNGGGLIGSLLDFSAQTQLVEIFLQHNAIGGSLPTTLLASVADSADVTLDLRYNQLTGGIPTELVHIGDMSLFLAGNAITELPNVVCNTNWNDGNTGVHNCDGILCDKGHYNAYGRAIGDLTCDVCNDSSAALVFGSTFCGSSNEHSTLISFYSSTGGSSWTSDTNWLQSEDHCSWEGITCHTSGTYAGLVQKIDLEENGLVGTLGYDQVWSLVGLEVLNVQKNDVQIDFTGVANAISLRSLILSETKTSSLVNIGGAADLEDLHLTNAELQGIIPTELFNLSNLQKLYLSYNGLSGTLSTLIGQLTALQDLYLFQNDITGTLPSHLGLLSNAEHIALGKNGFTGSIPAELGTLPLLEVLSLESEEAEDSGSLVGIAGGGLSGKLPTLSGLRVIRELYLAHNSFTGTIPFGFLQGVNDKAATLTVDLSYNLISGMLPLTFGLFGDLAIDLASNQISGIPDSICAMTNWFNGEVANGCDAILCEPETYNDYGRRVDAKTPCLECTYPGSALDYGSVACGPVNVEAMTDTDILMELYDATDGYSWLNSNGWGSDDVLFCNWYGITCAPEGDFGTYEVTEIDLRDNNLDGAIPSVLFHLPSLKKLNVRANDVRVGLNAIYRASKLEELYIDNTLVTSLQGISRASSLEILHVHGNSFGWDEIPEELFELSNLSELSMSDSMFAGTLPSAIGKMTRLRRLSLDGNALSGQIPSDLGSLVLLEELDISDNNWFGTLPSSVSLMTSLKSFFLDNGNGEYVGVSGQLHAFTTMPNLAELHLGENQFTGTIPSNFLQGVSNKASTMTVYLNGNNLVGTIPSELTSFSALNIYLEDNLLTAFGDGICDMSNWMDGLVGVYSCDAILCPAGKYNSEGRQVSAAMTCDNCPDLDSDVLGSSFCTSVQLETERGILTELYDATDGANWKDQDNWLDDATDICSWFGVECKDGSTVESLLLGGNRLVGTVPTSIYQLPNLKYLWLYSNHIVISFEGIEEASSLTSLLIDATKMTSLSGIGNGVSLVDVDVRFNKIAGKVPTEIGSLTNLESLILSENEFSGTMPSFSKLRKLTTLRVSNNALTGTVPSFTSHASLVTLDLSQNAFVGTFPSTLLDSVGDGEAVLLDLSDNRLTGTVPGELSRFTDMTIYLRNNRIEGINTNLCDMELWNGGDVGVYECDAILCPVGYYSDTGRASQTGGACQVCKENQYMGSDHCGTSSSNVRATVVLSVVAVLFTTTVLSLF